MTVPAPPAALAEPPPRRRLLGWTYWAGLTFGLVCVLLGLVIGIWGSRLVPPPQSHAPAALPAGPAVPSASQPGAGASAPLRAAAPAPDPRIAAPEAQASARAAAASLALAGLDQAAQASAPFAGQLDAVARALPDTPDLAALRALAAQGAPTRAQLAAAYPRVAARAVAAARAPAPGAGLLAQAGQLLTRTVTIRRTSRLTGADPDAVLARADRAVAAGDLDRALGELDALPPGGRAAAAGWRDGATRRLGIEQRLAALRAAAAGGTR